jgi:hypothetical protein
MTDYNTRLMKAADTLGEGTLHLIQQVLRKHDAAVIEASIEAIEAAKARDDALLRQALEALEEAPYMSNKDDHEKLDRVMAALHKRLGDKE